MERTQILPRKPALTGFAVVACGAMLAVAPGQAAFGATSGTWSSVGSLHAARDGHTATLLPNGKVVVAGGEGNTGATVATDLYSPVTLLWKVSGKLNVARASHQAALLNSGSVLVAGGCVGNCLRSETAAAEVYNPTVGSWALTGSLHTARANFGMVRLPTGKVLAVGGCTAQNANGCTSVTATAEIYDPATGAWAPTGSLKTARSAFTATLTSTGKVLVAGGINAAGVPQASAELYDPATGVWSATGSMHVARDEQTATTLATGDVLVAGGENVAGVSDATAELYNPATGAWTSTGKLNVGRLEHAAVLLNNGQVLVSGGNKVTANNTVVVSNAELYDPVRGVWTLTGSMKSARVGHTSTSLQSGLVLNAGGSTAAGELSSAETYQP